MALTNPTKIITVARLAEFLTSIKSWINTNFYSKTDADGRYAYKNGDGSVDFSVKKLKTYAESTSGGGVAQLNASSPANIQFSVESWLTSEHFSVPVPALKLSHSGGKSLYIPITDEAILTGVNGFNTNPSVSVFYDLSVAESSTPVYSNTDGASNVNNLDGTVVFIGTGDIDGLSEGFYFVDVVGTVKYLRPICAPDILSLYYNKSTSSLCYWTGSAFTDIAIGGGTIVIDDTDYDLADETDIDEIFTNDED